MLRFVFSGQRLHCSESGETRVAKVHSEVALSRFQLLGYTPFVVVVGVAVVFGTASKHRNHSRWLNGGGVYMLCGLRYLAAE